MRQRAPPAMTQMPSHARSALIPMPSGRAACEGASGRRSDPAAGRDDGRGRAARRVDFGGKYSDSPCWGNAPYLGMRFGEQSNARRHLLLKWRSLAQDIGA